MPSVNLEAMNLLKNLQIEHKLNMVDLLKSETQS